MRFIELARPSLGALAVLAALVGGCTPDYSPNTYASNAVQQANKVEPAVVIGFRQVEISASGTVGAVTGGAAGGVLGAQVPGSSISTALGTVGGALIGTIAGTGIEHATADTTGWEYIVRKPNGELLSVTQREPKPLPVGQKVLVITGNQARIIPDYSTPLPEEKAPEKAPEKAVEKAEDKKAEPEKKPDAANAPSAESKPAGETPAPVAAPAPSPAPEPPAPAAAAPAPAETSPAPQPATAAPAPPADGQPPS